MDGCHMALRMKEGNLKLNISAAKRLGVQESVWMDDWYTSYSPRNGNELAEGPWCQWVRLAELILAHEKTQKEMPEHYRPMPKDVDLHSGHHPDCAVASKSD